VQIAGFAPAEANRFFGVPRLDGLGAMTLALRAPIEGKRAMLARHAALLAAC
jgi:hypothetical protein